MTPEEFIEKFKVLSRKIDRLGDIVTEFSQQGQEKDARLGHHLERVADTVERVAQTVELQAQDHYYTFHTSSPAKVSTTVRPNEPASSPMAVSPQQYQDLVHRLERLTTLFEAYLNQKEDAQAHAHLQQTTALARLSRILELLIDPKGSGLVLVDARAPKGQSQHQHAKD